MILTYISFALLVAASFLAEDEEQCGQLQNLSADSVSLEFSGAELWLCLPTEHSCFPGPAVRPGGKHPNSSITILLIIFIII